MGLLTWLALAISSPAAGGDIEDALAAFNRGAIYPLPELNAEQVAKLRGGEVVRILDRPNGEDAPRRAVGMLISEVPRPALWISCQDPHFSATDTVTEALVRRDGPDSAAWYGYLYLPWPIHDRQWVIDVWNNHALATQTNGASWEHPWKLARFTSEDLRQLLADGALPALTEEQVSTAVLTPVNQGAWFAITLPDGETLLGYHATTVIGGNIPENLATQYVLRTLEKMLRGIEARAVSGVPEHYDAAHAPVRGGDGVALPVYGAP